MTALLSIENYHLDIPTFDGTLKVRPLQASCSH